MHAVKVLKATIEGSVDKSVRTQAAAKFASDIPDVGRPVSVLHTEEDLSHRGLTRSLHTKEYLFHRKSHQKSTHKRSLSHRAAQVCNKKTSKKERKKALPQPYTRNKNFDTTGAHKTQPANEGFKVPCNNIQTVVLLWICQQLSRSKNKILDSKRRLRLFPLQTKSSLDHRRLVVFLLLHKNLQASKSHVDELTLSKGVMIICT